MPGVIVPCPACAAKNRVDPGRLAVAVCGKCQSRLMDGQPLNLTAASFDRQVLESGLPTVVDFWAPWCGPCKIMAPAFAQAAARLPQVRFAKVDTQAEQTLGARFGIQSIPTMAIFRQGQEIARQSGAMPADSIVDWIRRHL